MAAAIKNRYASGMRLLTDEEIAQGLAVFEKKYADVQIIDWPIVKDFVTATNT